MSIIKSKKINKLEAFTLIEMMVAVSIFAIVVMISMTAILSVVDSNKKAQSLKSVMNNLNFALETMTRSIKTGTSMQFNTITNSLTVTEQGSGLPVTYKLGENTPDGEDNSRRLMRDREGVSEPITAPEVDIKSLTFYDGKDIVQGSIQPSVVVVIGGTVKINERISSEFNIQTTVTQRSPGI